LELTLIQSVCAAGGAPANGCGPGATRNSRSAMRDQTQTILADTDRKDTSMSSARRSSLLDTIWPDLRYALRTLTKSFRARRIFATNTERRCWR
jgi:hypothetical protein